MSNQQQLLLHDASNILVKSINKYILQNLDYKKTKVALHPMHGKLFGVHQEQKIQQLIWPLSEYSQELHDFINEYPETKIFIIVDSLIDNDDLVSFLSNKSNIKIIDHTDSSKFPKAIATYNQMYDHQIFHNMNLQREDKTVVILSQDNKKNESLLDGVLYPHNTEQKIVVVNNHEFQSPVNVGLMDYTDLAFILNNFSKIVDLDQLFELEASACDIDYIDVSSNDIKEAISSNKTKTKITDLSEKTYDYFVKNSVIQHIEN